MFDDATSDLSGAEALFLETLGLPFLSFVLDVDERAIGRRLANGPRLSERQEVAITALVAFLGRIPRGDPLQARFALSELGRYQPALQSSWPTAARREVGGSIDLPTRRDPLQAAMLSFVRDLYPLFLLPPLPEPISLVSPDITSPLIAHPEMPSFEAAVLGDPKLALLFPSENKHQGHHGEVYRSTGSGGGIQLSMFAESLLRNAWRLASQKYQQPTPGQLADEVLEIIDFVRKAVVGKRLTILALVGIAGLRLPEGTVLDLPWGRLREVTATDQALIPHGLGGQLSSTGADGTSVTIDYAGDLIMEMDVPYEIKLGPADPAKGLWPLPLVSREVVEHRIETLRLALILATSREERPRAFGTWQVFFDPLEVGRSASWRDPRKAPAFIGSALTEVEAVAWREWIHLVSDRRVKNIDVAIRRTLLAAAERADPTDALVDAVVAWENLVGSKDGEPTLRISAAMAWLLGKDGKERQEVRRRVSKLYGLRSDVVHGNRFLKPQEAVDRHREALDIAVLALRAVFQHRPDLLAKCKDSTERSLRLILDERSTELEEP